MLAAVRDLGACAVPAPMTNEQLRALVRSAGDVVKAIGKADPADKAALYADLGIRLAYNPERNTVGVELPLRPCSPARVGGANRRRTTRAVIGEYAAA